MTTEWFIKDGSNLSTHTEDPHMAIIGDYIPDWVRAPIELKSVALRKFKVTGVSTRPCPKCGVPVRHLKLEDGYCVAECNAEYQVTLIGCGFVWYIEGK